jgi:hypothetical protein
MEATVRRLGYVLASGVMAGALALAGVGPADAAAKAPGTGKPPAGSGLGTAAALANPLCDKSEGIAGYGKLDFVIKGGAPDEGGSPVCVAVWKGKNNGGATHRGVTKDSVKVIALVPNDQQAGSTIAQLRPRNNATGQPGSVQDGLSDGLAAYAHVYQTYGRDVDLEFVASSGDDEAAQRADAVTVIAKRPFAVFDANQTGHPFFEAAVATAKIPVFGNGATFEATQKQAPYRWGQSDVQSSALNVAEFAGKQLTGKKAEYAGDEAMHSQMRKLGLVRPDGVLDVDLLDRAMAKYGAKVAPGATFVYPASTATTGDPTVAAQQAPTAITKLKDGGVTTVILLTDSAMTKALLEQATKQDYHPEWIISGFQNQEFFFTARGYDQTQWAHAFGLSNLPPFGTSTATNIASLIDPVQWYWGQGKGTSSSTIFTGLNWVMSGIMYAGPNLTPKTFQQGLFAVPGAGGAPSNSTTSVQHGYGRTANLPYDEYLRGSQDYTVVWWDPNTLGVSLSAALPPSPGTLWYLDGAKRYYAGHWPTKPLKFFDESNAIHEPPPGNPPVPVPCKGCPSETGAGGSSTG